MVTLQQDALAIRAHLRTKRDFIAAVSGFEGEGKSSLGYQFCEQVDPTFGLERICYTNRQLAKLINTLPPYKSILIDEAVLTSHKYFWGDPEQRELTQLMTVSRDKLLFLCFVIPELWDLNPSLRRHRVRANYFIPQRGLAMCYVKAPALQGATDPWFLERWQEVHRRWKPGTSERKLIRMLREIQNYSHSVSFQPLPDDKYQTYVKFKHENLQALKENGEEAQPRDGKRAYWLGKLINEMLASGRFRNVNDAAKFLEADHKTVGKFLDAYRAVVADNGATATPAEAAPT
jgi:hypothetical protein